VNLAKCPACGSAAVLESTFVRCSSTSCFDIGPNADPDGAKWNALCARLLPPDCVAVPVKELEAVADLTRSGDHFIKYCGSPSCGDWLITVADRLKPILSHLPPRVDHVAVLRNLRNHVETRPTRQRDIEAEKAALEAAIAALEKEGR
jgi:hypothetical protein